MHSRVLEDPKSRDIGIISMRDNICTFSFNTQQNSWRHVSKTKLKAENLRGVSDKVRRGEEGKV